MAFGCHRSLQPSAILEIKDTQHSSLFEKVVGNATAGAIFVTFLRDLKRRQRKRLEGNRSLLLWLLCQPVGLLPKVSDWQTKLFVATTKNGISHLQNICLSIFNFPLAIEVWQVWDFRKCQNFISSSNINQTLSLCKKTPQGPLQRRVGVYFVDPQERWSPWPRRAGLSNGFLRCFALFRATRRERLFKFVKI